MKKSNIDNDILLRFIYQRTTQEEEKELQEWLAEDKSRTLIVEKLIRSKANLASEGDKEWANADFYKVLKHISRKKTRNLFFRVAAVFIGLVIASSSAVLIFNKKDAKWQTILVAKGEYREVILPDGTKVELAPDSKFSYPLEFKPAVREVMLDGEAFFDVQHQKDWPFIVHTAFADVEVLGTKFNLMAYANDIVTKTVLVEGKVKVGFMNAQQEIIGEQLLSPMQICTYNHKTKRKEVNTVDLKYELAWMDHRLSFRDESFIEIIGKIERYFNVKVVAAGALPNKRITGEFKDESVVEVLETLQEWTSFNYEIEDKVITIKQ